MPWTDVNDVPSWLPSCLSDEDPSWGCVVGLNLGSFFLLKQQKYPSTWVALSHLGVPGLTGLSGHICASKMFGSPVFVGRVLGCLAFRSC